MRVVLTGGGTGGHLFPLLAVKEALREKHGNQNLEFIFYGPAGKMERQIMYDKVDKVRKIASGKLRRYFSWRYFIDCFKLPLGILQSLWYLLIDMPDVVFAKGGYAAVPVVLVAWLYRIPILIHESDAKPGVANQFIAALADKVAISFERAKLHLPVSQVFWTGIPVDDRVLNGNAVVAKKKLGITDDYPVLFILGGSQGAAFLNRQILKMLPKLLDYFHVIHQVGEKHYETVKKIVQKQKLKINQANYYPFPFIHEEIKHFFALATIIISRAGATTIAEIAANRKPAILVPITHSANNHQRINAFEVARAGAAIVLEESNFRENLVMLRLRQILENDELRQGLAKNIGKFYNPQAAEMLAEALWQLGN